ncbi:MAG: M23 family metallopeptidase [Fibromonadaceae bacterium]|jgi:murein DD-endopeptidase MepM/ murein hydrolase activator NlpD|nr:M23 family metallopeptidase [Fibromonadaceae bacterium]
MAKKRKKLQVYVYSKGTDKPESYEIPVRVIGGWIFGLVIIIFGFVFWLPDNMINLKNFRVLEIAQEQKAMQLTANKLEKQIYEANSQIKNSRSLREKINQLAGLPVDTLDHEKRPAPKTYKGKKILADLERIRKSQDTYKKLRDALETDEVYANSLPLLHPIIQHQNITSKFGRLQDPITKRELSHRGLDFAVSEGDTVIATGDGTVEAIINQRFGFGTTLEIQHTPRVKTVYSHLQSILVQNGKPVKKGQPVALAGKSGSVLWPVLHYEVRFDNQPINPEDYFITR